MKICSECKIEKEISNFNENRNQCKECRKKYRKQNYEENKEREKERNKNYYQENKEDIKITHKKYYDNNLENELERRKKYYIDNKEVLNEKNKENYYKNREDVLRKQKDYIIKNRDKNKLRTKKYYNKNKKLILERQNNRKKIDMVYNLSCQLRSMIYKIYKNLGFQKNIKTEEIIGCSFEDFKLYIESKFEYWMNIDNKGLYNGEFNYGWDIDHIVPLASAKTVEDLIKLNHFSNLQPLCSKINRDLKRDKLNYSFS